ncbi:MAG: M28 family peptidase [Bacteroidales bacterium]
MSTLRKDACQAGFIGFDMNTTVDITISNSMQYNKSSNVAEYCEGLKRLHQKTIYSGHWDHFGIGEPVNGDSIYNGAVDNGTTMAWMFEIGESFSMLRKDRRLLCSFSQPLRSRVCLAQPIIQNTLRFRWKRRLHV